MTALSSTVGGNLSRKCMWSSSAANSMISLMTDSAIWRKAMSIKSRLTEVTTKLYTKYEVDSQVVETVACTVKVKVPDAFTGLLNDLRDRSAIAVREMLAHCEKSSKPNGKSFRCVHCGHDHRDANAAFTLS